MSFPSPARDYLENGLDLNKRLILHPSATFYFRAEGDAMAGAGIQAGDLLIVDRSVEPRDGSVVVASVEGELLVRTLRRAARGAWLAGGRRGVAPVVLGDGVDACLFGVVTWAIRGHSGFGLDLPARPDLEV